MSSSYEDQERNEFTKWWILGVAILFVSMIIFGALNYAGQVAGTMVERAVFEQSYQKKAAIKMGINTFNAQLAEITVQLQDSDLDDEIRKQLKQKAASIRVLMAGIGGKQ